MAKLQTILPFATFTHFAQLHSALRSVELRKLITKTQGDEIAHGVDEKAQYPADVSLVQRTPKGTVYVYVNDKLLFLVDQRGAFSWPSRQINLQTVTS